MKSALLLASAASLVLASGAASAQDTRDWTGPYIGGNVGYGFNAQEDDETILFDTDLDGNFGDNVNTAAGANAFSPGFCGGAATGPTPGAGCTEDDDEVSFGIQAGYDYQFLNSNFVLGGVVEYNRPNIQDSVSAFSTTPAFYTMTRELDDLFALRLRGGATVGDTLIYATGGAAYGSIENTFSSSNTANNFVLRGDDDAWGYQVGGGFEARLSTNISLGLQYLFTSLKDDEARVRTERGTAAATNPFILRNASGTDFARSNEDLQFHTVAATLNFRL